MVNLVLLHGRVTRPVTERVLPSGDRLTLLDLTVPGEPRADSVPLAWFDAPAWASALAPADELVVLGKVRRRFFHAAGRLESRTEVVVEHAAPPHRAGQVAAIHRRVTAALDPPKVRRS